MSVQSDRVGLRLSSSTIASRTSRGADAAIGKRLVVAQHARRHQPEHILRNVADEQVDGLVAKVLDALDVTTNRVSLVGNTCFSASRSNSDRFFSLGFLS